MSSSSENFAIATHDLRVDYGDLVAVAGIDLRVTTGSVFGLVGPNGAGKTSTIRVLATLQEPTYGEVRIAGIDTTEDTAAVHRVLGYMPDLAPLIPDLKVVEFLDYFSAAFGWSGGERRRRVEEVLERVGMTEKRSVLCKTLSRGMSQRVVLAKTLLPRPRVLLLDEPASGMDPIARLQLRDTLKALAADGATVLLSSHILTELADISTELGIMHRGQLLACGPVDDVVAQWTRAQRVVSVSVLEPGDIATAQDCLRGDERVGEMQVDGDKIAIHFDGDTSGQAALLRRLIEAGVTVTSFTEQSGSIEDVMRAISPEGGEIK